MGNTMKILAYIGLFISLPTVGMSRVLSPVSKIGQRNNRITVQAPRNFGKTHFIVGSKSTDFKPIRAMDPVEIADKKIVPRENSAQGAHLIDPTRQSQAFFTSAHNISSIILDIMGQAKKTLYVAAFTLTDMRIIDQLLKSHKDGVEVSVFVDQGNMQNSYSKVPKLVDNGVAVWRHDPGKLNNQKFARYGALMHHKFILVDHELVITGSANLTKAGQGHNYENIIILRDEPTVKEYHGEIERLKKDCVKCTPAAAA